MPRSARAWAGNLFWSRVWPRIGPAVCRQFHTALLMKTRNFTTVRWLGRPLLQNVLDLWTIQEAIHDLRPALVIETGTNRGGSSYLYAQLFDLMGGPGRVVTVDVARQHDLSHPRVRYLIGDSTSPAVLAEVAAEAAAAAGPVMVILDSDHSRAHVARELEAYAGFVTPGGLLLVQDGVVDVLPFFKASRPGPLPAVHAFLKTHPEFTVDRERCDRFLITDHPDGWLRRAGP